MGIKEILVGIFTLIKYIPDILKLFKQLSDANRDRQERQSRREIERAVDKVLSKNKKDRLEGASELEDVINSNR